MKNSPKLLSNQVPQADRADRIVDLVQHLAGGREPESTPGLGGPRNVLFYLSAARAVGLLDQNNLLTPAGVELAALQGAAALARLSAAFETSACGQAWLKWQGVSAVAELDLSTAEEFLAECAEIKKTTIERRAGSLVAWIRCLLGRPSRSNRKRLPTQPQTHLAEQRSTKIQERPRVEWPPPKRFPHNEAGLTVESVLQEDLSKPTTALVVSGYASLERVIDFLAARDCSETAAVRLLFGAEPYPAAGKSFPLVSESLADEIRDHWLRQGVSVLLCGAIIKVREHVGAGRVLVRAAASDRTIHAKMYATPRAVTLGSSNFTDRGLAGQSEANARFERAQEPTRFKEAHLMAESLWTLGLDYTSDFLDLLDELLRPVQWQEALARACATVLEGEWAKSYLPPDEIAALDPPLWPHQLQGISQALWILENVGSVLVSDATGSGKTRMGSWLLRGAFDRQYRTGHARRSVPVVVAPPQVIERWQEGLREAKLGLQAFSHGPLSNETASHHHTLVNAIGDAELLAVDEAHNFLNPSDRTRRLVAHYADHALLFTATPINRGAGDLLALVELLGADNFSEEALKTLQRLARLRRGGGETRQLLGETEMVRAEIRRFTVRRTRSELNCVANERRTEYALGNGRFARYPRHEARFYPVEAPKQDLEIAGEIVSLAAQLKGVSRIGRILELPQTLALLHGMTELQYIRRVIRSAPSLAGYFVMKALRSSRAALHEHIHGTKEAWETFAPSHPMRGAAVKSITGNVVGKLMAIAGRIPEWRLADGIRDECPKWLWNEEAHRAACEEDAAIYRRIGLLSKEMTEAREVAKRSHLVSLYSQNKLVIAFDSHVITLALFAADFARDRHRAELWIGEGGLATKRKAEKLLGIRARSPRLIALCSDALSEGMNLQSARCVVHLDTPTVIRTAEQRAGRVDRMDSPHEAVEIWWPRDPAAFAPTRRDLLRERHEMVTDLIGANLELPSDANILPIEDLARAADLAAEDVPDPSDLFDAFRPIRDLIGTNQFVPQDLYDRMRSSQAEVVACVSAVRSKTSWAFFAVGGLRRAAPRWVFFESIGAEPEADLANVVAALRAQIVPETINIPIGEHQTRLIEAFTERLRVTEHLLLPIRRRRALRLAERVVRSWCHSAWEEREDERHKILQRLLKIFVPNTSEPHPDPRSVAEAWLKVIRPLQSRVLAERRGRRRLWKIDDLETALIQEPIETAILKRAFSDLPQIPPVSRRIVAMIVGAPDEPIQEEHAKTRSV